MVLPAKDSSFLSNHVFLSIRAFLNFESHNGIYFSLSFLYICPWNRGNMCSKSEYSLPKELIRRSTFIIFMSIIVALADT